MVGKPRRRLGVTIVLVSIIAAICAALIYRYRATCDRGPWTITIGTATPGGTYWPIGRELARILNDLPGDDIKKAVAINTAGSVDNIQKLKSGEINVALVSRHALEKIQPKHVQVLARLYRDVVQLVVRKKAKIAGLTNLMGKSVYIGASKSGTRVLALQLLDAAGLTPFDPVKNPTGYVIIDEDDQVLLSSVDWKKDYEALENGMLQDRLREELKKIGNEEIDIDNLKEKDGQWIFEVKSKSYVAKHIGGKLELHGGVKTFAEAAQALEEGSIGAAFFIAGTPTEAVEDLLKNEDFRLMNVPQLTMKYPVEKIPANTYKNQPGPIKTLGTDAFLVCREDFPPGAAELVLRSLFEHMDDLLLTHARAEDIKLARAVDAPGETTNVKLVTPFDDRPTDIKLHPVAKQFQKDEEHFLYIATGALNGRYYGQGQAIQRLASLRGMDVRAIHTDGSVENARLLISKQPTIAIMQYDVALACQRGDTEPIYKVKLGRSVPRVSNIQSIAVLHEELVHLVIRRDRLEQSVGFSKIKPKDQITINVLDKRKGKKKFRVCLGPKQSGTRWVAEAILAHHGIVLESIDESYMPVSKMVKALHDDHLDAGFFVSSVPSEALTTILNDPAMRLLSLKPSRRALMIASPAFKTSIIKNETYACQIKGEPDIQTLATRAVLVTTEGRKKSEVYRITKAIFARHMDLGIEGQAKEMAKPLAFLELHPGAKEYYEKAGYLPSRKSFVERLGGWFGVTWKGLATVVILVGGYKGLIAWKRSYAANEVGRRILGVELLATASRPVGRLFELRVEIRERVRLRWWKWCEIDKPRWQYLDNLIDDRIGVATENLTRALVRAIRTVPSRSQRGDTPERDRYIAITRRIWRCFQHGELDAAQHALLLKIVDEPSETSTEDETA